MKTVKQGDKTELRNRLASAGERPCDCGHFHIDGDNTDCVAFGCPCQHHYHLAGADGWERAWESYNEWANIEEMRHHLRLVVDNDG